MPPRNSEISTIESQPRSGDPEPKKSDVKKNNMRMKLNDVINRPSCIKTRNGRSEKLRSASNARFDIFENEYFVSPA
jgi:hypothetical protein